jgi:hypothetical protein
MFSLLFLIDTESAIKMHYFAVLKNLHCVPPRESIKAHRLQKAKPQTPCAKPPKIKILPAAQHAAAAEQYNGVKLQ